MSWIRTIYLYLFALTGLTLVIIGLVSLIDLGLKIAVFRQADREYIERIPFPPPPVLPREALRDGAPQKRDEAGGAVRLTAEDQQQLANWTQDYKNWKERQEHIDPLRSRRERTASRSLAFLLVGAPTFFYHWRLIGRDKRRA